jgi:hypothetical protein
MKIRLPTMREIQRISLRVAAMMQTITMATTYILDSNTTPRHHITDMIRGIMADTPIRGTIHRSTMERDLQRIRS